jgi:hypothetical protein
MAIRRKNIGLAIHLNPVRTRCLSFARLTDRLAACC